MDKLELEIKELLIKTLNLEGMTPEEIDSSAPIFETGLGLDSIDALEIGIALQKHFKVKLDSETEDAKSHFQSVKALASFIMNLQAKRGQA